MSALSATTVARRFAPLVTLAVVLGVACSRSKVAERARSESDASQSFATPSPAAPSEESRRDMAGNVASAVAMKVATTAPVDAVGGNATLSAQAVDAGTQSPSTIIRSGSASVQVDSLERAIAALQQLATSLGGWVGNSSLSAGTNQVRSASVELKIPSSRYDDALRGLNPLGKVETVSSSAEDVGEEFVDLNARIVNAHRLEERLIALLANRTGKLQDALAVEHELARVREEIERQEGRLRYLKSRVAMSTLVVSLHEPFPVLGNQPGSSPIADAFREAWRNFVNFTAAGIASLGVLIPVGVLVTLAWMLVRKLRRGMAKVAA